MSNVAGAGGSGSGSKWASVYSSLDELPRDFSLAKLREMPLPSRVLMCPPDYFQVIDVKNPFMEGQIGKVEKGAALEQWERLRDSFIGIGLGVDLIKPVKDREDMVFCANQTFPGLGRDGEKICVLSQMKFQSRRDEVPAFSKWFSEHGYQIKELGNQSLFFEGCGDALWHPGRGLIWGGFGQRSDAGIYSDIARIFDVPVFGLELRTDRFYHLDTCFCPINEKTALVYPPSLAEKSLKLISKVFTDLIVVDQHEAMELMACNAAAFFGKSVVLQCGSKTTVEALKARGFDVREVETGEYMKSGGSVFCMKMAVY